MTRFKFLALLSLDPAALDEAVTDYPSGSHHLMVRSCRLDEPALRKYFTATIFRDDNEPLHSGDSGVLAGLEVSDDDACEYFGPGQHFTLWNGQECGHGVISRRVFSNWTE